MATYKCLLNGDLDADTRRAVVDGFAEIERAHFGPETATDVEFTVVEPGRWYTGGRPSQASMVLGTVPAGTTQDVREEVMNELATCFSTVTDTAYDDVMVVAADPRT